MDARTLGMLPHPLDMQASHFLMISVAMVAPEIRLPLAIRAPVRGERVPRIFRRNGLCLDDRAVRRAGLDTPKLSTRLRLSRSTASLATP